MSLDAILDHLAGQPVISRRKKRRRPTRFHVEGLEDRAMLNGWTVTSADGGTGPGTLFDAIERADAPAEESDPNPFVISFAIPGSGLQTISLSESLPEITHPTTIDGATEAEFQSISSPTPLIDIDGSQFGATEQVNGLYFTVGGNIVKDLIINNFRGANGFNGFGIVLDGTNDTTHGHAFPNNTIEGNFIGTDPTGTLAAPNFGGILIANSSYNLIGGLNSDGQLTNGNLISGNLGQGVGFYNGVDSHNYIEGNYIGTDITGLKPIANAPASGDGVFMESVAAFENISNNFIGDFDPNENQIDPNGLNVIAGNPRNGVYVVGGTFNSISGNYIGVGSDGATRVANGADGVLLEDASGNTVGGTTAGSGNVISGNLLNGISIAAVPTTEYGLAIPVSQQSASANTIAGNLIGTDVTGKIAVPNGDPSATGKGHGEGILLKNEATDPSVLVTGNVISGFANGHNVISGNWDDGILMAGPNVTNNTVTGNYIGTDITGQHPLENSNFGVELTAIPGQKGAPSGNFIGTTDVNGRNVISGNGTPAQNGAPAIGGGVRIANGAIGNTVGNNLIGTDSSGKKFLPNDGDGVNISAANFNFIGGDTPPGGNVISGNDGNGISIVNGSSGNQVRGNLIGTDFSSLFLPNADGVFISHANGNTIGGDSLGDENVIGGNEGNGVTIANASGNYVEENFIGVNFAQTTPLPNQDGIALIGATGNYIGNVGTVNGQQVGLGNVISENFKAGIAFSAQAGSNYVLGNMIGTDETGTRNLGNGASGILITDSSSNHVGGTTDAARNFIGFNGANGIDIESDQVVGQSSLNVIEGDYIGIGPIGNQPEANVSNGILINNSSSNTIGNAALFNVISENGQNGIEISGDQSQNNTISDSDIGTTEDGNTAAPNGTNNPFGSGVVIENGASLNNIGGNTISGNQVFGIFITDAGEKNSVTNNSIGTNADGSEKLNGATTQYTGVAVDNSPATTIGGPSLADGGNLISGNSNDGVFVDGPLSAGTVIASNYIGTDAGATLQIGNSFGIYLAAFVLRAGPPTDITVDGNTIAWNLKGGIWLGGGTSGDHIINNDIGTNSTETAVLPNDGFGIKVDSSPGNFIGEQGAGNTIANTVEDPNQKITADGNGDGLWITGQASSGNDVADNLVLGNAFNGIEIASGASENKIGNTQRNIVVANFNGIVITDSGTQDNMVENNEIGIGDNGAAKRNTSDGILVGAGASYNIIGAAQSGGVVSNIISANGFAGIEISGQTTTDNTVLGNAIGTDLNGHFQKGQPFGNVQYGIYVSAPENMIGGALDDNGSSAIDPGNFVVGSAYGIVLDGPNSTRNRVEGNVVRNNSASGVLVTDGASLNNIGGPNEDFQNVIHDNGAAGVYVAAGSGNSIKHNSIFENAMLGIHLDPGANADAPAPFLSLATTSRIAGWLEGAAPDTSYTLEFFWGASSQHPDGSEDDDADRFLPTVGTSTSSSESIGSVQVKTNGSGAAIFDLTYDKSVDLGTFIRATATDSSENTSQFSNAVAIGADKNGDGVPDSAQNGNVQNGNSEIASNISFPDALNPGDPSHGVPPAFITLQADPGLTFRDVWSTPDPDPDHQNGPPANTQFPFGFVSFVLTGVPTPAAPFVVTMTLPDTGITPTSYWRYGPTQNYVVVVGGQPTHPSHWYKWDYDPVTDTGAEIDGDTVRLHFVDGVLGDDDLAENGIIVDAGAPGFPDPYTVTTMADSGPGSLRQAILNADANPFNTITFDLPGSGPQTIQLLSPLPAITAGVTIDGSTQPGFADTPLVVLDGSQAGAGADGLTVANGNATIQDLVIKQFSGDGIHVLSGGSALIVGNYIGTDPTGKLAQGNGRYGVEVEKVTKDPDNDGDDDFEADDDDSDNDGTASGQSSTIDGGNVISANHAGGIFIHGALANDNQITNNFIGTQADGLSPLANGGPGVVIDGGSNFNTIGSEPGSGNTIAYNAGPGITIGQGIGNFIESNSIFANQGLGIDLAGGQNANAAQSAPVLASASSYGGQTFVSGKLTSTANSSYTLDFYATNQADALGGAQGQFPLGTVTVTTDNNGQASFDLDLAASAAPGSLITATAISSTFDSKTFSTVFNTSQFSAPLALTPTNPVVFIVNTTDDVNDAVPDPTHFSLREAILAANAHPGQDIIDFALPNSNRVIRPQSALPTITDPVIIDGTSQPGYEGLPLVELDGSQATSGANGLDITGGGSVVRGLAIHSFQTGTDAQGNTIGGHGIEISGQGGNTIEGNFIGTDVTGTRALSDQGFGEVYIFGSPDNTIGGTTVADRNVTPFVLIEGYDAEARQPLSNAGGNRIEGNYIGTDLTGTAALSGAPPIGLGVEIDTSSGNTIGGTAAGAGNLVLGGVNIFDGSSNAVQGNLIGTNYQGTAALPIGAGVKISGQGFAAQDNLIGGNTRAARNIIVGTVDIGGKVGTNNQVEGNYIGTDITGTIALGPGDGVTIEGSYNTIGGAQPGEGNLISGNAASGIVLSASANNNVIQGNYIGTDVTGTKALGNGAAGLNFAVVSAGYANTIGGTTPGAGNLISGNTGSGVVLEGNFTPDTVEGNLIGTDVTGSVALGNRGNGIIATEPGAIIGGPQPGAGNTISGNGGNGISVGAGGVSIQGNYIGTDVTGSLPLGNGGDGIYIGGPSPNDIIGGPLSGAGNVIANNGGDGIRIVDQPGESDNQNNPIASSGAIIQGNKIGTDVTGTRHYGNAGDGISFITTYAIATNETIGGADPGAGNLIAFNGGRGVDIPFGNGNAVRGNDIFGNGGRGLLTDINGALSTYAEQRGIDLPHAAPVLTSAVFDPQGTVVSGSLTGTPFTRYEIDFFANDAVNPSGFGDGQTYLQSISVLVDETGSVQFQIPLDAAVPIGQWITATATPDSTDGNTSEFSQPTPVVAAAGNTIQFASPKYVATETGGAAVIVVTRSGSTSGTVTVNYNTNDGSATAGVNYTAESGILVFADGVSSQTITVPVHDDGLADGNKDFQLVLSNPSGIGLGAVSDADVAIADSDTAGQIQFSSSSYPTTDRTLQGAVFTITRTGGSEGTVSVDYRVTGGTAVGLPVISFGQFANADYVDDFGTVTFAPGQTSAQVSFGNVQNLINGLFGDPEYRGPRSIELTLGNPTGGATLGAITTSTATLDDPEDQVGEFGVFDIPAEENAGSVQVGVQRFGNLQSDVSVGYTTVDGTAKAGTNYLATSGFVEFKPGQGLAFVTIPILDDHVADNDGAFQLKLTTASVINIGTTIPIFPNHSQASVTILDTDSPPPPARFEVQTDQSFDGYGGTAQVTVDRFDNTSGTDHIHYATSDESAKAGTDYQSVSGTLTFAPGQKWLTFSVPLLATNTRTPGDETFDVTLSDPVSVSDPTLGATIDPNNPVPVTLTYNTVGPAQFVAPVYPVADNSAELTVTVSGPRFVGAVGYATHDGTAIGGVDYTPESGTIQVGQAGIATISIPILNDLAVGGDKTFSLTLSNPQLGLTLGNLTTTTILILEPNPAATAPSTTTLTSSAASGSTYDQSVTFTAAVSAASGTPTGSVDFVDSNTGQDLGSEQLAVVNGVDEASVTVSSLVAGSHTIVATYTSDNNSLAGSHDSLTQTVAPATLTITAGNQTMAYGATVPTLTDTITGFVNGDTSNVITGTASLSTTATSASGVGNYTITIGAGTLSAANYTFDFVNGTLSVTPATLTVTADDKTMVYGATAPALTDTISGFVNGDAASVVSGAASISTAPRGVGNYVIDVAPGTLSAANYTFAFVDGALTVTPATLTVTADNTTMVYGATLPSFTDTITGFVNGDTSSVVGGASSLSTTATSASGVGSYPISVGQGTLVAANYTFVFVDGTLTVSPATLILTVTADDKTMVYGSAVPALTDTITGFVNGDTSSVVSGAADLSTTATSASAVGSYPIDVSLGTLSAANYTFAFVDGTLTITPAPLTITADDQTMTYGGALPTLTVTYTGLANGDTSASLTTAATVTAPATDHVGTYTGAIVASGAVDPNYTISYAPGTLKVTPAALTIAANDQTMTYGGTLPTLTVAYTGLVNGDTPASLTTAPTVTAPATNHVGTYMNVIVASGASDPDYTISYAPGTLNVTPATLTVTADNKTKVYGQDNPPLTGTITGFVNGDTASVVSGAADLTTSATAASGVGNYTITVGLGTLRAADYTFDFVNSNLSITPATLTVTADDKTMVYGATVPPLTDTITGFVNGDTASVVSGSATLSTTATTASGVGSYPISVGLGTLSAPNYTFDLVDRVLMVDQDNTTTTVGASAFGLRATLTATVTANAPGSGTPTGSVDFFDATTNTDLGSVALSAGTASLTATLPDATQSITVNYQGDANFLASSAATSVSPLASVYVLNPSVSGALAASGNAAVKVPGVVVDDSSSAAAITASGNVQIAAGEIDVVGGVEATGHASFSPTPQTGHAVVPDPYRSLAAPSGGASLGGILLAGNASLTIHPGVYNQINVSGNAQLTMTSGVYVIAGGGLSVSGNASVNGTQVMIYNAGGNYLGGSGFGDIDLSGNGRIVLSAPTSGPYAGVLLFQARDNQQGLTLSGNAVNGLSGTIYAANAPATISGNASLNLPVVVNTLTLNGNAVLGDPPASSATLSGSDPPVSGFELSPLVNVAVATFMSSDASETASAFTATIDWGDGSTSAGTITQLNNQFAVSGSHTYGDEGSYSIVVSVSDGQATTTIAATAKIAEELLAEGTPGTANQRFITEIYRDVLGRQAEPQGRDYWVSHLERGDSRAKVVQDILAAVTEEYHRDLINAEFARYLQRSPDPAAMQYFTGLLDNGGDAAMLDAILVSSPEYIQEPGGTLDQFVDALFRDALGRPVDPAALTAVESRSAQGATRAQIADVVFSSEEYRRDLVAGWYRQYLDRAPDAAGLATYTSQLDAGLPAVNVIAALLSSDEFVGKV